MLINYNRELPPAAVQITSPQKRAGAPIAKTTQAPRPKPAKTKPPQKKKSSDAPQQTDAQSQTTQPSQNLPPQPTATATARETQPQTSGSGWAPNKPQKTERNQRQTVTPDADGQKPTSQKHQTQQARHGEQTDQRKKKPRQTTKKQHEH